MRHHGSRLLAIVVVVAIAALAAACGSGAGADHSGVTIEPLGSATPRAVASIGGKPDATASAETPAAPAATADTAQPEATGTVEPATMDGSSAPTTGRWIDVDVTSLVVRLMDGTTATQEIAPVAIGAQVDTGAYASTQTGLFHVYNKNEVLAYDPPYDTYISHWVGFDPDRANGFHSFLKDASGKVVDSGTGRISNGCIRTGAPDAVFAFAEIGMPVYVHH